MRETENYTELKESKMLRDYQQQAVDKEVVFMTDSKEKYIKLFCWFDIILYICNVISQRTMKYNEIVELFK